MGVEGDSTVGLLMTNDSAEAISPIYGVLMAGGAYVPLDASYPAAQVKLIAVDAELKALLFKDEEALAEHGNIVKCPVLSVTQPTRRCTSSRTKCHGLAPSSSQHLLLRYLYLRHNRKAQRCGDRTSEYVLFHSTPGFVYVQGPGFWGAILAFEPHDF